ncbi:MAG TPA: indolepyruvate oxidoreductase subunit beta [Dehalococcoidia bacterium]|nr:indolepyruvate oxidoreductase subunit beta [Dehalococcoidia bacterium]
MNKLDLFVTGVGGQGNILASDLISETALATGYDVKKTDTLGMAQRNGSVISHVRIAERVYSPLIKQGNVDILLAFEKLEAVRWCNYLRPGAITIINNHALPPLAVNLGVEQYPDDDEIQDILRQRTDQVYLVDGTTRVAGLGNTRTLNIFMLGCFSHFAPFEVDDWKRSFSERLPERLLKINLEAFEMGRKEIQDVHV